VRFLLLCKMKSKLLEKCVEFFVNIISIIITTIILNNTDMGVVASATSVGHHLLKLKDNKDDL